MFVDFLFLSEYLLSSISLSVVCGWMCVIKEMFVFSLCQAGQKMRNIDSELNGIGDIIMYAM